MLIWVSWLTTHCVLLQIMCAMGKIPQSQIWQSEPPCLVREICLNIHEPHETQKLNEGNLNPSPPSVPPTGGSSSSLCHHLLGEESAFSRWAPQVHGLLHLPVCCHCSRLSGLQEGPPPPKLNRPHQSPHSSASQGGCISIDTVLMCTTLCSRLQSSELYRV